MNDDIDLNNTINPMKQILVVIDDIHRLVRVLVQQLEVKVVIENDEIR